MHARGDARDADARSALRDAALRFDRARSRRGADSPEGALALWRALVEGRWSLVERFESDGRRIMVARRNDPASRASRALSEHERKVVALLALGHSLKVCAYELGRAESTISEMAHSAMRKLRVRTRAELVELHGAIVPTANESPTPEGKSCRRAPGLHCRPTPRGRCDSSPTQERGHLRQGPDGRCAMIGV